MKNKIKLITVLLLAINLIACDDFLDREPLSDVTPAVYFKQESDLQAYSIKLYDFPTHWGYNLGTFTRDNNTDNQATKDANKRWIPGEVKVPAKGGDWKFGRIRKINYFFEKVLPLYEKGEIQGNTEDIKHYIGEMYFLRAYEYFNKLKTFGDFPIIKKVLNDNKEELIEASKRRPRNEVARFILEDLDEAIKMMKPSPINNKNRLSREVAELFKSRVALYEGTWLKYHAGTALVPGGPGWPGASKEYLSGFTIDLEGEINFFLTQAMESAKSVADKFQLEQSNGNFAGVEALDNLYFQMFGAIDMGDYDEVLFWRAYDKEKGISHNLLSYYTEGANTGYTRSLVESFLMKNGLPIYDAGSGYKGDNSLANVRADRDGRLQLFLQIPGEVFVKNGNEELISIVPNILTSLVERKSITGYMIKKGVNGHEPIAHYSGHGNSVIGSIVFRATEAYLNYIEASYVKNGSLDGTATAYWGKLRTRAGLPSDINVTINATDLSKEKDWAKYSGTNLVDPTLYNIRRERRCEFIAEGMRYDDLKRWRALDQVKNYQIEGFKLWNSEITPLYNDDSGNSELVADPEADPNVSPKANSDYLRPYQINKANNNFYNGYNWIEAHYLTPIAFDHFLITSPDGNAESSVIYQNPGWPIEANGAPIGS